MILHSASVWKGGYDVGNPMNQSLKQIHVADTKRGKMGVDQS